MHRDPQPAKLYTIASMYRYSAPQRGRFREHWQLSVEAIGSDDPAVDAEVIQLYGEILRRLGIERYELLLNSIGDRDCRPAYVEQLSAWLDEHDAELDDDARAKRETSPLRVFDTKSEDVRRALESAPTIAEALCAACREHFDEVRRYLDAYGVSYTLVPTLVRGLDYYTRTTFEFVDEAIGAQSSICGGGRYDGLAEALDGRPTPGIGFGAGIERLLLSLDGAEASAEQADRRVLRDGGGRGPGCRARGPDGAAGGRARLRCRLRGAARARGSSRRLPGSARRASLSWAPIRTSTRSSRSTGRDLA